MFKEGDRIQHIPTGRTGVIKYPLVRPDTDEIVYQEMGGYYSVAFDGKMYSHKEVWYDKVVGDELVREPFQPAKKS